MNHGMTMSSTGSVLAMGAMGLLTSVVAPLLLVLFRGPPDGTGGERPRDHPAHGPGRRPGLAVGTLLGFAVLHTAVVLAPPSGVAGGVALHVVLLAGGIAFWLPVLGRGPVRLSDAGRTMYLFLACPLLDTAALALVVQGEEPAGIAMIVGMFPVALAAVVLTWRWIAGEERAARVAEVAGAGRVS